MRALPTLLLLLSACSDTGLTAISRPYLDQPHIEVSPQRVEFGDARAQDVVTRELTLKNVGGAPLSLTGVGWLGQGESFDLGVDLAGIVLEPEGTHVVPITFSPRDPFQVVANLQIFSNDPQDGAVEVDLIGSGLVPRLQIDPPTLDFGETDIGCADERVLTLSNTGAETLTVGGLDWSGDAALQILGSPTLPLALEPGNRATVTVRHAPTEVTKSQGSLLATSDDPAGPITATQTGTGVYGDQVVDQFEAPVAPPVDILFAVDQSCSMEDDASRLGANFSKFVEAIGTVTRGWRVGVATHDSGCFRDGWYTSATPSYQDKFRSAVWAWDGGSYTEALLSVARSALRASATGCNRGFLRSEANLHVILVSDEPEQSPESWSRLVSQIRALHPTDPARVKISAVAGDYPRGCSTAAPGEGYWQAVNDTGGEYLSICDNDWARHAATLAKASVEGLSRFELSQIPDPRTLAVYVNSVEVERGFRLEGSTLVFEPAAPEGAAIRVEYGALGCQ